MNEVWLAVAVVGAATVATKAVGPVVLGGRGLPRRLAGVLALLAPAVLAAAERLRDDERLAGVAAAAVALRLRAPLLLVVAVAAAVTAALRAL